MVSKMFLLFDVPVGMGHYSLIGGGFKHCVFLKPFFF